MSATIENQVVSMQFDNKHFESNVKTSMSTLEKLKQSLKLHDAAKGFDNVSKAAKKVDLAPIGKSVQTVIPQFSALYTTADHYFRKLLASADRLSAGLASALTIDPIKTGFQEYETQINAVQTILANTQSKGTTLDDVNGALDLLNAYADKTIYNFTEMTRNIGTFTAAGVDLDTSVSAIQGIANLAAVSGSNAQQASTAMYQLSQALASGTVKLMDWNSVVNAGMGGQVFQDALKETARVHDVEIDKMIKKNGSFRETLQEGWLTSEILTETLWKFTLATENMTDAEVKAAKAKLKQIGYTDDQIEGIFKLGQTATDAATKVKTFTQLLDTLKEAAQSGWTQTWELLIGDFEAAKFLWTGLSDAIGGFINKSSETRNTVLEGALQNSGWDKLTKKINEAGVATKDFEEAVTKTAKKEGLDVDALIKEYGSLEGAVQAGKISTDMLKKSLDDLKKSGDKFNLDSVKRELKQYSKGKDVKSLEEALKKAGFEPVGKDGKSYVDEYFGTTTIEAVKKFQKAKGLKVTGVVDEKTLAALKEATKDTAKLTDEIYGLINGVTALGGREKLIESFKNAWAGTKKVFESIKKAWDKVFPPKSTEEKIAGVNGFIEALNKFSQGLIMNEETAAKLTRVFEGLFAIIDIVTTLIGGGFKLAFKTLTAVLSKFDLNILDVIAGISDLFVNLRNNLNKGIDAIADFIVGVYNLPEAQKLISTFGAELDKIKASFSEKWDEGTKRLNKWIEGLKSMDGISLDNIKKAFLDFKTKVIDFFLKSKDGGNIFDGLITSITDLWNAATSTLGETGTKLMEFKDKIVGFFKGIKEAVGDKLGSGLAIATLLGFFWSIKKVFDAFGSVGKLIGNLSEGVLKFTESFTDFMDELGDAVKRVSKAVSLSIMAQAVKNFAIAIAILVGSLIALSYVPIEKLLPALGVLTGVIAILTTFAIVLTKFIDEKDLAQLSLLILALGGSLMMFAYAAKILGGMDGGSLAKGALVLAAFVGAVSLIALAGKKLSGEGALLGFGKMMMKLSLSLLLLAAAIKIFGSMDSGTLLKGLGVVTLLLLEMVGLMAATNLLAKADKGQSFAKIEKIMISFAAALLMMSAAIAILGNMDTKTLVKGIAAATILFGEMLGLMWATKLLAKAGKGESFVKIGGIIAAFGAALLMMSAAVAILGKMDLKTLVQGGLAVTAFMGIMLLVMKMSQALVTNGGTAAKAGLVMLEFAGAMVLLTGAIVILGMIKPEKLFKAVGVMAVLGLVFAVLMDATAGAQKQIGTILALAGAVAILAVSLAALTFIDSGKLTKAGLVLSGVIATFALLTASTKFISLKAVAAVAILGLVVAGLAYVIKELAGISGADKALEVSTAISILMLSLSATLSMISAATNKGNIRISNIVMMALALGAIGLVAGALAKVAIDYLPTMGEKLAGFLEALKPFLDGVKDINPAVITSIGTFAKAMGTLADGSAKFAVADTLTRGGATKALSSYIGWLKELLPVVKEFATELSGVTLNQANLDSVIGAVSSLVEAAGNAPSLTVAGGGFGSKWGGGGGGIISVPLLTAAKDWIVKVAPVVRNLGLAVSKKGVNIDKANLEEIVTAAKGLAEAAALAPSVEAAGGGFTSKWVSGVGGVIDWPLLAQAKDWIVEVAPIVQDLAESVSSGDAKNLDGEKLTAICTGAKILAEATAAAPSIDFGVAMATGPWGSAGGFTLDIPMLWSVAEWIKQIQDPMLEIAKAVSSSELEDLDVNKFNAIIGGVKTLCEAANAAPTLDIAVGGGWSSLLGFIAGGTISIPQLTEVANFIDEIELPITNLAKSVNKLDMEEVDIANFQAIVKAITDIASVEFPTLVGGGFAGIGGIFGLTVGGGVSIPQITEIATFITKVKDPIIALANATATGLEGATFNADNFKAITQAIVDISSAKFPTYSEGGGLGVTAIGVIAGYGISAPQITEVTDFITKVKQPIIDLANATATGLDGATFNADNFKAITQAIVDISSAKFPQETVGTATGVSIFGIVDSFGYSGADITGVLDFITQVKQPMIDLANAVSETGFTTTFNSENFKTIVGAVIDLASVEYPDMSGVSFDFLSKFSSLKLTDQNKKDFTGFVTFINDVKDPIKNLATAVSGDSVTIDPEKIGATVDAVKKLAEGTKDIPTIGGVKELLEGKTDFTGFVSFMGELAPTLTTLTGSLESSTIDPAKISTVTQSVKHLAEAASAIPDKSEWWQFWSSNTDWDAFVTNVPKFGTAISDFSTNLGSINTESTGVAALAVMRISDALLSLNAIKTVDFEEIITKFAKDTGSLVTVISDFSNGVAAINVEAVNTASGLISTTVGALQTLTTFDPETAKVDSFNAKLGVLAMGVSNFSTTLGTADPSTAITAVNDLVGMLTSMSTADFTGANSFKASLTTLATTSVTDFTTAFTSAEAVAAVKGAGSGLMDTLASGISSNSAAVGTAADGISDAGSAAIKTKDNQNAWKLAGQYVGQGFVNGIKDKLDNAAAAGTALGKAALDAAMAALGIHSPSREFYKVGEFAGMGLVNALREYERNTYKAGYSMGDSAKSGLGDAISKVQNLIENGIDAQPTIRPVLDLSDVSAGADGINRMFNMRPSIGLTGKLGNISEMMDQVQNGGNEDVIAAINKLGGKISESGRDTYNINGITYDDGSNITDTVKSLIRAVLVEGRV